MALNCFRGHITLKTASEGQKLWHFPYRALRSSRQRGGTTPLATLLITSLCLISVSEQN